MGEAGIAEIRQGLAAYQSYFLGLLEEAYEESGHPEEGLRALAEAQAVMDTTETRSALTPRSSGLLASDLTLDTATDIFKA